jgi:hypothetical protein
VTAQNILGENRLDKSIQAVEAKSHVYWSKSNENTSGRRDAQHRPPPSRRIKLCMGSASRQRIVSPEGETNSIAHGIAADVSGIANLTSWNATGTGKFAERFAFFSHQFNVAFGTPY